jgi:alpha-glucosidase
MAAALPGALYLYQGEELGLHEVLDIPPAARQDPLFIRTNGQEPGRDGCRVPLPWTDDPATSFGFSPVAAEPWLPQPDNWGEWSVENEDVDPNSMLTFYRTLLEHRPQLSGGLTWVDFDHPDCVAFERDGALIVINVGPDTVELPSDLVSGRTLILASQPDATPRRLPTDTCVWLSGSYLTGKATTMSRDDVPTRNSNGPSAATHA